MRLVRAHMKLLGRVNREEAIRIWDEASKKQRPD
jgi:hypothetical protein